MRSLSLSLRLWLISLCALVGIVFVGSIGVVGSLLLQDTFSEYRAVARAQKDIAAIETDFLLARIASMKFRLIGDPVFLDEATLQFDQAYDRIRQLRTLAPTELESDKLSELKSNIEQYEIEVQNLATTDPGALAPTAAELDRIGPIIAQTLEIMSSDYERSQDRLGPEGDARGAQTVLFVLLLSLVFLLIAAATTRWISKSTADQVKSISSTLKLLSSSDDYEVTVHGTKVPGQLGFISQNIEKLRDVLKGKKRDAENAEKERAELNLKRAQEREERLAYEAERERETELKARQSRKAAREELAMAFEEVINTTMASVASSGEKLLGTARGLSSASKVVKDGSTQAQDNTKTTERSVTGVTGALDKLTGSVGEVKEQIGRVAHVSSNALERSEATGKIVGELQIAGDQISSVLELISGISEQTNLLALNATIEAARAGDAGKGFAVVASEVKALANQSATAADEISRKIDDMRSITSQSVTALSEISSTIVQMNTDVHSVSQLADQQVDAAVEIANAAKLALDTTKATNGAVESVAKETDATVALAEQVKSEASILSNETELLRLEATEFLEHMRN